MIRDMLGDARYASLRHPKMVRRGFGGYESVFRGVEGPKNILLCCPEHTNIGDQAITLAECRMLQQSERPFIALSGDTTKTLKCLERYVSQEDVVFLHGGGNMGTLYRNEEEYRLNGITFFPQEPPYLLTIPIYWEIKLY